MELFNQKAHIFKYTHEQVEIMKALANKIYYLQKTGHMFEHFFRRRVFPQERFGI